MTHSHKALGLSGLLALLFVLSQALSSAYAATYAMTLQTDAPSYSGTRPIVISGAISPVPGANTAVIITIKNAAGTLADIAEVVPSTTNGSFGYVSHPGGSAAWSTGTFTVNATWGGDGETASSAVTFTYLSSTTSSSSSASSSAASGSSTSSGTTSTTSTPAPEFPSSALALVALVGAAAVAAVSRRRSVGPSGGAVADPAHANAAKTD